MSKKAGIQIWRWKKQGAKRGINSHVFFQEELWHILCIFPPDYCKTIWFLTSDSFLFFNPDCVLNCHWPKSSYDVNLDGIFYEKQ